MNQACPPSYFFHFLFAEKYAGAHTLHSDTILKWLLYIPQACYFMILLKIKASLVPDLPLGHERLGIKFHLPLCVFPVTGYMSKAKVKIKSEFFLKNGMTAQNASPDSTGELGLQLKNS